MRDIKFRAWDQATMGHWDPKPQGMVFFSIHYPPDFIGNTFNENQGKWERRFIIEQFTGLQDSDGIDIYEGDIVEDEEHYCSVISWDDNDSMYVASDVGGLADLCHPVKIIGNIHENPELLG